MDGGGEFFGDGVGYGSNSSAEDLDKYRAEIESKAKHARALLKRKKAAVELRYRKRLASVLTTTTMDAEDALGGGGGGGGGVEEVRQRAARAAQREADEEFTLAMADLEVEGPP